MIQTKRISDKDIERAGGERLARIQEAVPAHAESFFSRDGEATVFSWDDAVRADSERIEDLEQHLHDIVIWLTNNVTMKAYPSLKHMVKPPTRDAG